MRSLIPVKASYSAEGNNRIIIKSFWEYSEHTDNIQCRYEALTINSFFYVAVVILQEEGKPPSDLVRMLRLKMPHKNQEGMKQPRWEGRAAFESRFNSSLRRQGRAPAWGFHNGEGPGQGGEVSVCGFLSTPKEGAPGLSYQLSQMPEKTEKLSAVTHQKL